MSALAYAPELDELDQLELEMIRREELRRVIQDHPAPLLDLVQVVDAKDGSLFGFHLEDEQHPWNWQRELLDWWLANRLTVILKARQLGVTWVAAGLALWTVLFRPGTDVLVLSKDGPSAKELVTRIWEMYLSIQKREPWLLEGIKVVKPDLSRSNGPSDTIEFEHPDGRISTLKGLAATPQNARSNTAAVVILDEFAFAEYARGIMSAVIPTLGMKGKLIIVSTANGVHNPADGTGNFYHRVWEEYVERRFARIFIPWFVHPDRSDFNADHPGSVIAAADAASSELVEQLKASSVFYQQEAMALDAEERAKEYPSDELEAFTQTGSPFFPVDDLQWYRRDAQLKHQYRMQFAVGVNKAKASIERDEFGFISVYTEPRRAREYAIAADVAEGTGEDYSCATVIDLSDGSITAVFHGKLDYEEYAEQLHFLGRWYGEAAGCRRDALIAVEVAGGYGDTVIRYLRDGKDGRPAYKNLYRHVEENTTRQRTSSKFGFPMKRNVRPHVLNELKSWIKEHAIPALPQELLQEMTTFVKQPKPPSPAAQQGCNDDRVMSAAIAYELFRRFAVRAVTRRTLARAEDTTEPPATELKGMARYGYPVKKQKSMPLYPWQ